MTVIIAIMIIMMMIITLIRAYNIVIRTCKIMVGNNVPQ